MSRKRYEQEQQLNKAREAFFNQEAERVSSTIKTVKFIKPATNNQRLFVKSIKLNDLTVALGPSGCGKTLLALFTGVQLINDENSSIERIIYVRANIDHIEERDMGALPGDAIEKLKPLAYPVLDNLSSFIKTTDAEYLLDSGKIEVLPLMMMRGRSFSNSFIIVDESQNTSPKSMKTILTRMGEGSKLVVIGDTTQVDTKLSTYNNGLADIYFRIGRYLDSLKQVNRFREEEDEDRIKAPAVGLIEFIKDDIVRHGLTRWIIEMYQEPGFE